MDCNALTTAFPRMAYLSATPQYENSTNSYFAAFENELRPACVLLPMVVQDVVDIIKYLQTTPTNVKVAVRGGGHTPWAGAANIENGITIDMRKLAGVTVSANNVVSIAAGEVWASVYTVLEEKGLAVVGGRVSKVGVTGLTIGGMVPASLFKIGMDG
jgi:FAD/FMN-containing dehydrogenase